MSSNSQRQNRRDQINNSSKQLPGDQARADGEQYEDFDAGDTGNFNNPVQWRDQSDPQQRQQINESDGQLPGDKQRSADDEFVDEHGTPSDDADRPARDGRGAASGTRDQQ